MVRGTSKDGGKACGIYCVSCCVYLAPNDCVYRRRYADCRAMKSANRRMKTLVASLAQQLRKKLVWCAVYVAFADREGACN